MDVQGIEKLLFTIWDNSYLQMKTIVEFITDQFIKTYIIVIRWTKIWLNLSTTIPLISASVK